MSDLSPKELALLATLREEWGPSDEVKDAVRAAIPDALRTMPELGPDGPPGPSDTGTPKPGGMSRGAWAGAGLAVASACVVALVWMGGSSRAPAPVAEHAATPATAAPAPRARESAEQSADTIATVSLDSLPNAPAPAPSARAPLPAPAASGDTLAEELALVRAAQSALRSGAPDDALAALSTHATRFPRGVLREERMTLQVLASCDRGDVAGARAMRAELEKVAPGSSHLQRLATSCAAK